MIAIEITINEGQNQHGCKNSSPDDPKQSANWYYVYASKCLKVQTCQNENQFLKKINDLLLAKPIIYKLFNGEQPTTTTQ